MDKWLAGRLVWIGAKPTNGLVDYGICLLPFQWLTHNDDDDDCR